MPRYRGVAPLFGGVGERRGSAGAGGICVRCGLCLGMVPGGLGGVWLAHPMKSRIRNAFEQ